MDTIQDDAIPMPPETIAGASSTNTINQCGYPIAIILNGKADEKFCCGYCKNILRDPAQTSCGHRFCQDCLKIMEGLPQPVRCEACVEEGFTDEESILVFQGIFEDRAAKREMRKLQVRCIHPGCVWKGSFKDFTEHEDKCEKKKVTCSLCGTMVSKGKLANHESRSCPKRTVKCQYCKENIVYESKEKHTEECPKFVIKCDKCQASVERSRLGPHEESECANRVVTCTFPGCNTKLTMDKFLAHISQDVSTAQHVVYLLDCVDNQSQKLKTLEDGLHQLAVRRSATTASVDRRSDEAAMAAEGGVPGSSQGASSQQLDVSTERTQGDGAQAEVALFHEDRQKLKLHEDLMSVLHSEILRCINVGEALGNGVKNFDSRLRDCYKLVEEMETRMTTLEGKCGELVSEGSGHFTWIIKGYSQVKARAINKDPELICSPIFVSSPGGYNMRLKLYANGEGMDNTNKNVSLFLQNVSGPSDDLLLWPYNPKIHFMLVDQKDFRHHYTKVYQSDTMSPASQRPVEGVCFGAGFPSFISVQDMNAKMNRFCPKDVLYLKFHIELPKPHQDRLNSLNPLIQPTSTTK